jgi:thioredoxin reductase (NADPH)
LQSGQAKSSNYDVVVVGAGPAGISAAINVANRKRSVLVLDSQQPFAKTRKAPGIPNYPGFTYASGEELAAAFVRHMQEMEIPFFREKVSKIYRDDSELLVFTEQEMYHAQAVILATGVYREVDIEGEEAQLGRGVNYCINCDGRGAAIASGRGPDRSAYKPDLGAVS